LLAIGDGDEAVEGPTFDSNFVPAVFVLCLEPNHGPSDVA
jgi:hypothetical protein